jgi:hypothetical protein
MLNDYVIIRGILFMTWSENMPTSKDRIDYIESWKKENTDLIRIRVPKGRKELYMDLAKRNNKSLTAYITNLLEKELKEEQ